jgi:N-acetylglucosamine-6-phosphate deacetylase
MAPGPTTWWTHAQVHTGEAVLEDHGVATQDGIVQCVAPADQVPEGIDETVDLNGAILTPGFVDLQVNGGGGATFTETPDEDCLATIAEAHREAGTTAYLATCISAPKPTTLAAIQAVAGTKVTDCAGLHLEGPALDLARSGAHDPDALRALDADEITALASVAPHAMRVTLSVEHATGPALSALMRAGTVVSFGHSEATAAQAHEAFDRGVTGVTHLFNAMSGMTARDPGLVGAALARDDVHCGIIADGVHVDATTIGVAWRAKPKGKLHLVSDSIALAGSGLTKTYLGGRRVRKVDGRCVNDDGTLAGSNSRLIDGVRFCVNEVGIPLEEALRMASWYPARHNSIPQRGRLVRGSRADMVVLTKSLDVARVISG